MEIKKLTDILEWADSWINGMKDGMTEEEFAVDEEVKAFEAVKKVVDETIERHSVYTNALNKDIAAKAAKIELLEKELDGRKAGYAALKERMDTKYISIDEHNDICKTYEDKVAKLEKDLKKWQDLAKMNTDTICDQYSVCERFKNKITELEKEIESRKIAFNALNEEMANSYIAIKTHNDICKSYEDRIDFLNEEYKKKIKEIEENKSLKKQVEYLNKELDNSYKAWEKDSKNYQKRDMTLVDELAGKNDKIKNLVQEVEYYKNQERIRTDQLRATESKVEELWKRIEKLEEGGDDHGRTGFKKYIEYLIEEEERAVPERFKARLNEEITTIFEKEKETMKYKPSEIDRFIDFLKNEVDKKRIVDISEGAEKILGVSRELFDDVVKALVDDGYQEIIGRIPKATNSYVYIDMHVLATPDVKTKETANAENIKSLDSGIPCGSDSIE